MSQDGSPQPQDTSPPSRLARRGVLLGTVGLLGVVAIAGSRWFNVNADVSGNDLIGPWPEALCLVEPMVMVADCDVGCDCCTSCL